MFEENDTNESMPQLNKRTLLIIIYICFILLIIINTYTIAKLIEYSNEAIALNKKINTSCFMITPHSSKYEADINAFGNYSFNTTQPG